MIEIKNVNKSFESFNVLKDINLTINDGEIIGIVGKSGAGKSTLLRTLNRLEEIDSGEIIVDGINISLLKGRDLQNYRKTVSMIFQHFALLETQSIYNNIALPLRCNKKYSKEEIDKKVKELASEVEILDKLDQKPRSLSGGQRQRVAIARALATNPKILLSDEATSALDPKTTKQILSLLKRLQKKLHFSLIIVTHQMEVVKEIVENVVVMEEGQIVEKGKTVELFLNSKSKLNKLSAEEEILPTTGVNIKLLFDDNVSNEPIITSLARDLNIDFSICWGKLEKFSDEVLGSLIININELDEEKVINYLKNKEVKWEVL
ncbi:MAG: methionine ABC transporter ATP-binding protein [Bacilli bacterium]|nr:methionine ABC transporter ATP-binding protein [Bacilli bacterium]